MCEPVCGIEKKGRAKTASGDGATRNRILYGFFFIYIYTCHASLARTFLQYRLTYGPAQTCKLHRQVGKLRIFSTHGPHLIHPATHTCTKGAVFPLATLSWNPPPSPSSATSFKKCCDLIPEMASLARVSGLMMPSPTLLLFNMAVGILKFSAAMDILVTRLTLKISCLYLFI